MDIFVAFIFCHISLFLFTYSHPMHLIIINSLLVVRWVDAFDDALLNSFPNIRSSPGCHSVSLYADYPDPIGADHVSTTYKTSKSTYF